ncbi:MAG: PhoH family protein [Spirochaetales bacterium]|nr:PhoH family protein [Spirochaetales bacterium]
MTLDSDDAALCDLFSALIDKLRILAGTGSPVTESEIFMEYQDLVSSKGLPEGLSAGTAGDSKNLVLNLGNRSVYPKSPAQRRYLRALDNSQVTFGIGPAGTGKTFLAVAWCLSQIISGRRQKLILTRPVVEAGESLGFLPGDLSQKLNPYLKPLYDAMEFMISPQMVRRLEESNLIEIAPLAYMRGRSLHHACVILDEAQNTTVEQMKMFLTRLGEDTSAIVTGDITQTDLPRGTVSGLVNAMSILQGIEGISFVNFHSRDVVRSRIVQRIVDAYDKNQ